MMCTPKQTPVLVVLSVEDSQDDSFSGGGLMLRTPKHVIYEKALPREMLIKRPSVILAGLRLMSMIQLNKGPN